MQLEPFKPTLKAPGTYLLKLKYDEVFPGFAFNFNLRRYTKAFYNFNLAAHQVGRRSLTQVDRRSTPG